VKLKWEQECPTLWRLYEYLTDEEKINASHKRQEQSKPSLAAYIASDEWCYNCAASDHWGDVSSTTVTCEI
jgi:protein AIR1/2